MSHVRGRREITSLRCLCPHADSSTERRVYPLSLKDQISGIDTGVTMRVLLTVVITLCVLLPFANQTLFRAEPEDRPRVELLEAEHRFSSSVGKRDARAVDALLTDGVRIVGPDGELLEKARVLAAVRDRAGNIGASLLQSDVRFYDTVALVHGRSVMSGSHMYVLRAWVRLAGTWRLALEHVTDITEHAAADPPAFATLEAPIPARPAEDAPEEAADEAEVRNALRESHERYWAKDVQGYQHTVGADLIRAAETGVRTGTELVAFMRGSPHLPRQPSRQLEMWTKVFGNVAIGGWLDAGTTPQGADSRNRFTLALVWRDGRWQIVQIQSTAVEG
jgi:Domain of unknown function (DUF4440)